MYAHQQDDAFLSPPPFLLLYTDHESVLGLGGRVAILAHLPELQRLVRQEHLLSYAGS